MKKQGNTDVSTKTVLMFGSALLLNWLGKQITKLTKYFPFSLISDRWYLHHKNSDILSVWDALSDALAKTGTYFHVISAKKDEYFVYMNGEFEGKPKKEKIGKFISIVEKKFGAGNVFLRPQDNKLYSIKVTKASVDQSI